MTKTPQVLSDWDKANPIGAAPPDPAAEWDKAKPLSGDTSWTGSVPIDYSDGEKASDALVYSKLLGIDPSQAYQAHQSLTEGFGARLGQWGKAGLRGIFDESILGELWHGNAPAPLTTDDEVEKFIEGFGRMTGDLPVYLVGAQLGALAGAAAGGVAGSEAPVVGNLTGAGLGAVLGGPAGGFALTEGLRQWLVDKYSGKDISAWEEVMDSLKASGKGLVTGAAMGAGGEFAPLLRAGPLARGAVGRMVGPQIYKAAGELASLTTVGSLLEGRVPTKQDFINNAAYLAAMHIGLMGYGSARDYLGKTYVAAGAHPTEVTANPESVTPPMEEGEDGHGALRPALKIGEKVVPGQPGETHDDILEREEPPEEEEQPPADRTYQDVQNEIDALENKLEGGGERAFYFKGGEILAGTTNTRGVPYEPMPPELEKLYEERDAIGSGQLRQSVDEIVGGLRQAGITKDEEINHVLEYYALDPRRTDVGKQYLASQHTQKMVDQPIDRQVERAYVALASERGIPMDDEDDLYRDKKTTEDAKKAVAAIHSYFFKQEARPDRMLEAPQPEPAPNESAPEPEYGFLDPRGNFLSRSEARNWVDQNEPETAKTLPDGGLRSEDYNAASAQSRRGGPVVPSPSPEVSTLREEMTRLQAKKGWTSKFGNALRSFFVGSRDARIAQTNQLADSLRKVVPDYRDQEALTLMRDFRGREGELQARRDRYASGDDPRLKKLIPIIDRALNPSDPMAAADRNLTEYFTQRLDEGKRLGFIDSSISSDEYITHLIRPESEDESDAPGLGPRPGIGRSFRFAKERHFDTVLDAIETGKYKAQTLNALDALTIYGSKHATAAATKIFINELKQGEMGRWGFRNSDAIPSDWVELASHSPLFRNTVPSIDRETGEAKFAYQSLYVPKVVADGMRPIIESDSLTGVPGYAKMRAAQAYVKAAELGLSVFHMKALNITAFNNAGVSGWLRSLRADSESPEFKEQELDGIQAGLQTPILGRTVEAYRALKPKTFPTRLDAIRDAEGFGAKAEAVSDYVRGKPVFKQLDQTAEWLTHETFDVMQRKFKVTDYAQKTAAWMAKHPEASEAELNAAKRGIAKEVNAAYGGLNWEVLGANRTTRGVLQAILLAPDWTFSNIFNVGYAFEGGAAGSAARAFWARSFLSGMIATQAMSKVVTGQMSSHPTEVYLGRDKKGRDIYGNMFFAGAPKDFVTFLNNVADYGAVEGLAHSISSKLSPFWRGGAEAVANRDWMGREIVPRGSGVIPGTVKAVGHIAGEMAPVPFSVSNIAKMLTDTEHDYGFWDYASVLGGSPPRHELPPGAKPEKKKRSTTKKRPSFSGAAQ